MAPKLQAYNILISIHVRETLDATWLRMEGAWRAQRDPDEGVPVRQLARAEDHGRRVAGWDWVSTAPTRDRKSVV